MLGSNVLSEKTPGLWIAHPHFTQTTALSCSVENLQPRQDDVQGGYQQPVQPQPQQTYQGYNNPSYGTPYQQSAPQQSAPQSFNVDVADDDLPF